MNSNETDRSNHTGDTNGDKAKYLQEQKEVHSEGKTQENSRVSLTTLGNYLGFFVYQELAHGKVN